MEAIFSSLRYIYCTWKEPFHCVYMTVPGKMRHSQMLRYQYHRVACSLFHTVVKLDSRYLIPFPSTELRFFSELAIIRTQCIGVANTQHVQIAIFKFAIYLEKPETQLFYYAIKTRPTVRHMQARVPVL